MIAISSDDGLKSCLPAARMLHDRDICACFFVLGSMVGVTDPRMLSAFGRSRLAIRQWSLWTGKISRAFSGSVTRSGPMP